MPPLKDVHLVLTGMSIISMEGVLIYSDPPHRAAYRADGDDGLFLTPCRHLLFDVDVVVRQHFFQDCQQPPAFSVFILFRLG